MAKGSISKRTLPFCHVTSWACDDIPHLPKVRIEADFGKGLVPMRSAVGRDDNALMGMQRILITFE